MSLLDELFKLNAQAKTTRDFKWFENLMTTYRWTINLTDGVKIKSVSVNAANILELVSRVSSRYPGYDVVFAARMEAVTK